MVDLSNNALATLAPGQFAGLAALRWLHLDGNALEALPAGLFAGVANLLSLHLDGNPGAPFALRPVLARADAAPWAPGPATVRMTMPIGAPFDIEAELSATGGTLRDAAGAAATSTEVLAGGTQGAALTVVGPADGGAVLVDVAAPSPPETICDDLPCWRGLELPAGERLVLFSRPPRALPASVPEALFGDSLRLPLMSLVEPGEPSGELSWSASSSNPAVARARIADGLLLVEPEPDAEGSVVVEATATDASGQSVTVAFDVEVEFFWRPRPAAGWRSALVR